jgi:hypothetical protein
MSEQPERLPFSEHSDSHKRFEVEVWGESYREGSSYPWRAGTYTAEVVAESRAEAIIEVLEGLSNHGKIRAEGGDCEWAAFDDEREMTIRVKGTSS